MVTIFKEDREDTALELDHKLFPEFAQEVTLERPVITGAGPEPYAPIVIGEPEEPDLEIVIEPSKTSPRLKKTKSPGWRLLKNELNLDNVFHGVLEF